MANQDNRDRTEPQAPAISVAVHVETSTELTVDTTGNGPSLNIRGWDYPSVVVFFPDRDTLVKLGAAIGEYLDATA